MKADYDSQADAISIELTEFDHFDDQEQVDEDFCTVGFVKGQPVNVALLGPAKHFDLLALAADRHRLDRQSLEAITRAALAAPDRVVELKVGASLAA